MFPRETDNKRHDVACWHVQAQAVVSPYDCQDISHSCELGLIGLEQSYAGRSRDLAPFFNDPLSSGSRLRKSLHFSSTGWCFNN